MIIKSRRKEVMAAAASGLYLLLALLITIQVHAATNVSITVLETAVEKGAVCLDGTPPAYYYFEGSGDGAFNWIVYLEGGGWCNSENTCHSRSLSYYGSSQVDKRPTKTFNGLLDDNCTFNPDFCNWHKVFVHYCDGSSFQSNIEEVDPKNNLTFRGRRIFNALMDELIAKGMGNGHNVVLSGSSAGGLATILHCDLFAKLLPLTKRVKCISDSGFFIRGMGLPGIERREVQFAQNVVRMHKLTNTLPTACTSNRNPDLCLFPEYLVGDIQTPLFIIESAFDSYQVEENLFKGIFYTYEYKPCIVDLSLCNATLASLLKDFGRAFKETLEKLDYSSSRGMFIHSCFRHAHIYGFKDGWTCSSVVGNVLANKAIGQAVRDWYFDRCSFKEMDMHNDLPLNCTTLLSDPRFYQLCLDTQY